MKERLFQVQQLLECTCSLQLACIPRTHRDILHLFRKRTETIFDLLVHEDDRFFRQILELPDKQDTIYEFSTPGDVLYLKVWRNGQTIEIELTVGEAIQNATK